MIPYFVLFGIPAFAAFSEKSTPSRRQSGMGLILVGLLLALMIGLRYRIGADWSTYANYITSAGYKTIGEVLLGREPGYQILNWIAAQLDLEVWFVNLICGSLFSSGLVAFCRNQPRPWLALTVAIPYLVIVVAMGYSRQGVAIGLSMIGLVSLSKGNVLPFVVWVVFAALFHRTAILMIPIAALAASTNRLWTFTWVGVTVVMLYFLFLDEAVDSYVYVYLEKEYSSQGALIRTIMNVIPALIFLYYGRRMASSQQEYRLWLYLAIGSLLLFVGLFISSSSTAIDRMALYMIPVQIFVFSRLPGMVRRESLGKFVAISTILYYASIMIVWLTISSYAVAWVPYRTFLL